MTTEERTATHTPGDTALPPAWTWASLALALIALVPVAVAIGRWGWTPNTGSVAFVVLVTVVAVEAWVSATHREGVDEEQRLRHRIVEASVLALLVVAVAWIGRPVADLRPDRLLGADLVVVGLLAVLVWVAVTYTHRDLVVLRKHGRAETGQLDPLERLTRRALLIGLAVALSVSLGGVRGGVVAVVVYVAGAALGLARLRFAALERRWEVDRTRVGAEVRPRLRALVGGLVVAVTVVASLLPRPVEGGARTARAALEVATEWLARRFDWLFADFLDIQEPEAPEGEEEAASPEEVWGTPEPVDAPVDLPEPLGWLDPYWAVFGWVVGAALVTTVLVLYLRARPELARTLGLGRAVRALRNPRRHVRAAVRLLVSVLRSLAELARRTIAAVRDRAGAASPAQGPGTDPGGGGATAPVRSPAPSRTRARVLAAYREVVETAASRGSGRAPVETPYEYEQRLAPRVPTHDAALRRLTESFIVARYSTLPVGEEAAERAVDAARLLREVLTRGDGAAP